MHTKLKTINLIEKANNLSNDWPEKLKNVKSDDEKLGVALQAWDDGFVKLSYTILNRGKPSINTLKVINTSMNAIIKKQDK